ncbi:MAG: monofunctional biosynthetic peptidoglycan transglycosylase [Bacteroidales bacterium]|nr:monofunctional biosynthetic peptidoglycan transglycosylase [Bacteroidales bacterium]
MKKRRKGLAYWLFVRIPFWFVALSFAFVLLYKVVPVYYTPLMLVRFCQGEKEFHRQWKPLGEISPEMVKAVIASEDNRFATHHGFDWIEVRKMLGDHKTKGKKLRGCSTISQQTAKNVFTFGSSTWARKGLEAWFTVLIEWIWGKERIMEVYLNIAETGHGMYGVQAAAKEYFGIPAASLTRRQAASIAIILPSPLRYNPKGTTPFISRRRNAIVSRIPNLAYPNWVK